MKDISFLENIFATFFENKGKDTGEPIIMPSTDGVIVETYPDRDPYYYRFSEFEELSQDTSLEVRYIGDWAPSKISENDGFY